ncbi:MAG: hypothetical protein J0I14_10820 [Propionibacteriaceae bacterium]|jgi:hypothetical protein|nr:hypothetical protein [Propionibacteriaceae bacterium]
MEPGSVFHYTSAEGLLGIIESKVLWASEASSLNDTAELNQGWEIIDKWLSGQPDSDTVSTLRYLAEIPRTARTEVLVLSASTDPEDAGQWRNYGAEGRGYAVEIDAGLPLAAVAVGPEPAPENPPSEPGKRLFMVPSRLWLGGWERVLYSSADMDQALHNLIEYREEKRAWEQQARDGEEFDERWQEVEADILGQMATLAGRYKSPGFMGEREHRVLVGAEWGSAHLHHRAGRYGVVAYAELTGAPDASTRFLYGTEPATRTLPIRSVRVGPGLPEENVRTVQRLLRVNGFEDVAVKRAEVPLR